MGRRSLIVALIALLSVIGTLAVLWPTVERLLSPGPLSRVHAGLEARCSACHLAFTPLAERGKCKSCHEEVARDVRQRTGFHGRTDGVRRAQCRTCHLEHRGRVQSLIDLRQAKFDHQKSDFPIGGKHRAVQCRSCHLPAVPFRAAPLACVACHARDDEHRGRFGRNCASCHSDAGWKIIRAFDHGVTRFPLTGAHQKTPCAGCHVGRRYRDTPRECVACHLKDDVHKGTNGRDCASCHSPISWKGARFDHDRTRFPLVGRHAAVACASCHGARKERPRPPMTCIACHRQDDVHRGANGTACATCHSPLSWKGAIFDHDRATRFALRGAHRRVPCAACHVRPVASFKPPMACVGCHQRKDVHRGALGRDCANCHSNDRWKPAATFSHARTRFPLAGAHVRVTCASCHRDKSFRAAGTSCASCHADTVHKGRFGSPAKCAACHSTANWTAASFDHSVTRFPLTGRHARLLCTACHVRPARTVKLSTSCVACHKADDPHEGRFGTRCETCHTNSESFKGARVPSAALAVPVQGGERSR
jgi:hypothetical protein